MDNIANEENINTEKIINLIKKNLKKEHFRSHNDIIKFLENKKYLSLNLVFLIT